MVLQSRRRSFSPGFLILFWVGLAVLVGAVGAGQQDRREGEPLTMGGEDPQRSIFVLHGPNDGEPLNGRYLRFTLETSYSAGTVNVSAESRQFHSLDLQQSAGEGSVGVGGGVVRHYLDLDMELLQKELDGVDFSHPDTSYLRLTATLYLPSSLTPAESEDWEGAIGFPWIEFPPDFGWLFDEDDLAGALGFGDPGGDGSIEVVLHPRAADSFYFVLASQDRADLEHSPEATEVFQRVAILAGGSLFPDAQGGTKSIVQNLDDPSKWAGDSAFLVLWTFHPERGWDRSQIYAGP